MKTKKKRERTVERYRREKDQVYECKEEEKMEEEVRGREAQGNDTQTSLLFLLLQEAKQVERDECEHYKLAIEQPLQTPETAREGDDKYEKG